MPRQLRADVFNPNEICIVHCVQRCVRRAFLTGPDHHTGINYDFRRDWIHERLKCLAMVFGIDILDFAILSNHFHIVLRTRPDIVAQLSDEQVALRWLSLFPGTRVDECLAQPSRASVDRLVNDPNKLAGIRVRLSDPSWFMRSLSEPIARIANRQDNCTGRFWEGRFKAQAITDEAGLLACSMYIDLNPIRAAMAENLSRTTHTSASDRMAGAEGKTTLSPAALPEVIETEQVGKLRRESTQRQLATLREHRKNQQGARMRRDAWLAPLTINERAEPSDPLLNREGTRASDKGFLNMRLDEYQALLEWTSQNQPLRTKQPVPDHVASVLRRLRIDSDMWLELAWRFKKYFPGSAAGSPESVSRNAAQHNHRWRRGQRASAVCFTAA